MPNGNGNYNSFTEAVNALNCGITGSVIFNVVPGSGPYNEQVHIPQIDSASSNKTITFNGNGEILKYAGTDSMRHVIKLDGADYITIRNLTILATDSTYGIGIHLINEASNDSIFSCLIDVASNIGAGIAASGSATSYNAIGNNANYLTVTNSEITGGYYGIILCGDRGMTGAVNNKITNTIIHDFYSEGVNLNNNDGCKIIHNDIHGMNRTNAIRCGIAGSVVFDVEPNSGPYNEAVEIPDVAGTSVNSRISFFGNGNILTTNVYGIRSCVLRLNGTDFVTIKDLIIRVTPSPPNTGTDYGINLMNQADNDSIINCRFEGNLYGAVAIGLIVESYVLGATRNSANNTYIANNIIDGWGECITISGSDTTLLTNNKIVNNLMTNFSGGAIYLAYTPHTLVSGNTIQNANPNWNSNTNITISAIELGFAQFGTVVEKNKIIRLFNNNDSSSTAQFTAIHIFAAISSSNEPIKIVNNLISGINHNGVTYIIYINGQTYVHTFHNSIILNNTNASASTAQCFVYIQESPDSCYFRNNIIYLTRGGNNLVYDIRDPEKINNNDIFVNPSNTTIGDHINTFAAWQALGYDSASVSIDPLFASPGTDDYTPTEPALNNLGMPLGLLTDLSGNSRDPASPDMGCYEFGSLLPLALKIISADIEKNNIRIKWSCEGIIGIKKYEIERSTDGISFKTAGMVNEKMSENIYTFLDNDIVHGNYSNTLYYRVKSITNSGSIKYSSLVSIKLPRIPNTSVVIFPDPFRDRLSIKVNAKNKEKISIAIIDFTGQNIKSLNTIVKEGDNFISMKNLNFLRKGIYFIKVYVGNKLFLQKALKE